MDEVMVAASTSGDGLSAVPWLIPVITLLVGVLGGGGFRSIMQIRHDRRMAVAQQENVEDDSLSARWQALIRLQTEVLLEPLQAELKRVSSRVTDLEQQLAQSDAKYKRSLVYVRSLLAWIARHMPDHSPPEPPPELAGDI